MPKDTSQDIESITSSVIRVYEILKAEGPLDHEGEGLQFLHWNQEMSVSQKEARGLIDNVVKTIAKKNPLVSEHLIVTKIVYHTIGHALWYPKDVDDIYTFVEHSIRDLLEYKAHREVDVPVIYLGPGTSPLRFGLITFYRFTTEDRATQWWDSIKSLVGEKDENYVDSYARVIGLGDHQTALDNADKLVDEMLTIMRAVGFPITTKPQLQFGVVNDHPPSQVRPYRIGQPIENRRLEGPVSLSWRVGPGVFVYDIQRDLLSKIDSITLQKLQELIESDFLEPRTETKKKFFLGIRWLGEATKPDTIEGRFVKLAFALEALVGGEPKQETLSARGLTATLAERSAFLVGKTPDERQEIHKEIYTYYGIRSGIVHGGAKQVSDEHIIAFASLVRKVAWALLDRINEFPDVDSLQKWVHVQRYS
jgi:hypothetical protein